MRVVPAEYQQKKQKEFRVFEFEKDDQVEEDELTDRLGDLTVHEIDCCGAKVTKGWNSKGAHMSQLPNEMLYKIAMAVIGPNLSYKSLSKLGMTCKAFYGIVRDDELWRSGCEQLWERKTLENLYKKHSSYRF